MDAVAVGVVGMIVINHVVQLVGWNKQGSVVSAIRPDTSICVFARFSQEGDVVADPAPASVTSIDSALGMIALKTLQQFAKILIGGERIRIVGTGRGRDVITP